MTDLDPVALEAAGDVIRDDHPVCHNGPFKSARECHNYYGNCDCIDVAKRVIKAAELVAVEVVK